MATKKDKDYHGITIEVNGEVIGKVKEWKPVAMKPTTEKLGAVDFVPIRRVDTVLLPNFSVPLKLVELWNLPHPKCSGKSNMALNALRKLLEPGHLYMQAQLAMWGITKTGEVCDECLAEIVTTLEDMGYNVWFEEKVDEEFAESCGVVMHDYKLEYVGRGEDMKDG